eukprot:1188383-Prorocentrum_minimum.AAC.1
MIRRNFPGRGGDATRLKRTGLFKPSSAHNKTARAASSTFELQLTLKSRSAGAPISTAPATRIEIAQAKTSLERKMRVLASSHGSLAPNQAVTTSGDGVHSGRRLAPHPLCPRRPRQRSR